LLNVEVFTWIIGNFQTSKSLNIREREYRCLCSYYVINNYASLMCELKKKLKRYLRVNLFGPGPSFYKRVIYRAAVSQRLRNTGVEHKCNFLPCWWVSSFTDEVSRLIVELSDKNSISALHELCTKLYWGKPVFEMYDEDVTLTNPIFLMKVLYNLFFFFA
jgi:hypothetical protein